MCAPFAAKAKFGAATEYEDYELVQPAVIVADAELHVIAWWSWRKVVGVDLERARADAAGEQGATAMQPVDVPGTTQQAGLVMLRPSARGIAAAALNGEELSFVDLAPAVSE